ncbi:MocR-like ectoine utilization transcription factor EhuR [Paraburkholderia lycopersici]|uniref:DNA-binding transcriptional regulator, MocR family, contains an aminotransferase domain n=1 Tax=Paraburkholderia lycopersici TaxID=416944 RepID=A0A1G6HD60_9BURK|nr:PLP-dependent aminotransferase family protein [Paraburkholderia lycopersici]SDB92151.1 DNA-binding transcriptional regulator, MocR family, contains an aminotransferase domain [Paraburkholderia lycopersici]
MNGWMPTLSRSSEPKYRAIAHAYAQAIDGGQMLPGEKLPAHRLLARKLGVTTGTVSRAYAELERCGMVVARVGDGTYVAEPDADGARMPDRARPVPEPLERAAAPGAFPAASLIDLGQNVPMPTDEAFLLTQTLRELAADERLAGELLLYQPEGGRRSHREAGARWLARMGCTVAAERVLVTQGAQHGLACVLRAVLRPGDTIFAEALSYPGIVALARQLRLNLVGIEIDDEGIVPAALERACSLLAPRALFCVPTLHNPTTATLSEARRAAIAEIAARHHLVVIEDLVPAALLDAPPTPLAARLPEHGIVISSLSKAVAPGLRIGYVQAPQDWVGKILAVIRSDCWMTSPLAAEIAARWIVEGEVDRLVAQQRAQVDVRHAIAAEVLAGSPYRTDPASPHLWLPLAEPWRAAEFSAALRQAGVLAKTADSFVIGRGSAPHAVRLSLGGARSHEALREGLERLARTLRNGPEGLYSA